MRVSTIEPVQVVLAHQFDQLGRVVRGSGVTGLVDLARECVGIALELEGMGIAPVAEKKPGMFGDALFKTLVFA